MSDTEMGLSAIEASQENQSQFDAIVSFFEDRIEEIEIRHQVGDLTITRTVRLAAPSVAGSSQ